MSPGIFEKPVDFEFVIDFAENDVSIIFAIGVTAINGLGHVKSDSDVFVCSALAIHRLSDGREMSDRVIVFFLKFVKITNELLSSLVYEKASSDPRVGGVCITDTVYETNTDYHFSK